MKKVGIIGASGYTGGELLRLLGQHPELDVVQITSERFAGQTAGTQFPGLQRYRNLVFESLKTAQLGDLDGYFLCLPHGKSMPVAKQLMASDTKIVDLSADFRMKSVAGYEEWYIPHTAPELCAQAVYGLPELYRTEISTAKLIANPGCYVTSVLLPLLPLFSAGLQPSQPLIIDAKSGVSGAGRNPGMNGFYAEANENFSAYKIGRQHRHIGEMEEQLSFAAGSPVNLIFTPHLLPVNRGILSTIYLNFEQPVSADQIQAILGKAYADEMFVRVMPAGQTPCIAQIRYSNRCDIGFVSLNGGHQLVLVSCLDNILKGASGQAVQNMNLLMALPEALGLPTEGAIT